MGRGSRSTLGASQALDALLDEPRTGPVKPAWIPMLADPSSADFQQAWLKSLNGDRRLLVPTADGRLVEISQQTSHVRNMLKMLLDDRLETCASANGTSERRLDEVAITQRAPGKPIEFYADGQHRFNLKETLVRQWRGSGGPSFADDVTVDYTWQHGTLYGAPDMVIITDDKGQAEISGLSGDSVCTVLNAVLSGGQMQDATMVIYHADDSGHEYPHRLTAKNKGLGAPAVERIALSISSRKEQASITIPLADAQQIVTSGQL